MVIIKVPHTQKMQSNIINNITPYRNQINIQKFLKATNIA